MFGLVRTGGGFAAVTIKFCDLPSGPAEVDSCELGSPPICVIVSSDCNQMDNI